MANVFAVQRQVPVYWGNEGDLTQYPSFSRDIPVPHLDEKMTITRENDQPIIRVGNVFVSSLSGSGILHIGSTREVGTVSRTKHIRHFIVEEVQKNTEYSRRISALQS